MTRELVSEARFATRAGWPKFQSVELGGKIGGSEASACTERGKTASTARAGERLTSGRCARRARARASAAATAASRVARSVGARRRRGPVGDALAPREPRRARACRTRARIGIGLRPRRGARAPSRCSRPDRARRTARIRSTAYGSIACMRLCAPMIASTGHACDAHRAADARGLVDDRDGVRGRACRSPDRAASRARPVRRASAAIVAVAAGRAAVESARRRAIASAYGRSPR